MEGQGAASRRAAAILAALLAVLLWGASFVATRVVVQELSPIPLVWLRFGLGVTGLAPLVWRLEGLRPPPRRAWAALAWAGLLGVPLHQVLQAKGVALTNASTASWITATAPVFMALLGWLALREPARGRQVGPPGRSR